jgi:hypothetical protein
MSTQRLSQSSLANGEIGPSLYARTDITKYATALRKCRNFVIHRTGGASNRAGLEFLGEVADSAVCPELIPFRFNNTKQVCMLEFGENTMRAWYEGGLVTSDGSPISIVTSYGADAAHEMGHAQSGDEMYLAHHGHAPAKLSRESWTDWTFSTLDFTPDMAAPSGWSVALSGGTHTYTEVISYKITAVSSKTGEESLPCAAISATGPTDDDWPVGTKMALTGTAQSDAAYYRVYKSDNGIYGWIGNAADATFSDDNITPDVSDTPPEAENPFDAEGDYPSLVAFHQQRLWFFNTNNVPHGVWASRSGFFENMSHSFITKDDDALNFNIGFGEINAIKGALSVQDLIIFTSGSENVCNGGSTGKAVTASIGGISVKPQSYWGSGDLPPLVSGNTVLFLQGLGSAVRDLFYDYSVDGFVGNDKSILARHLFDGFDIVSWAYAQVPDSTFWLVRSDGALLSLTYFREQDIGALALHTTNGKFERVAVIPGNDRSEVWFVVKRTINGATKRYVERLAQRRIDTINDAKFLDSFLVYDGTATKSISGLDHLEGMTVGVFADGNVLDDGVVARGAITLPRAYSHVVIGLRYDKDTWIETLDVD